MESGLEITCRLKNQHSTAFQQKASTTLHTRVMQVKAKAACLELVLWQPGQGEKTERGGHARRKRIFGETGGL